MFVALGNQLSHGNIKPVSQAFMLWQLIGRGSGNADKLAYDRVGRKFPRTLTVCTGEMHTVVHHDAGNAPS